MTITNAEGVITGQASLREVKGGVVMGSLRTHPQPGRHVQFAECELTVSGGKLAGTIDHDKGKIEFVR